MSKISNYQINSVVYDVLSEFAESTVDDPEEDYNADLAAFIHNYCATTFNEELAEIVIVDAYPQPHIAFPGVMSFVQMLQIDLEKKLVGNST